jgi:hypothetical protein
MGYTTTFKGQFHCYRVEGPELGAFLKVIQEGDLASMGPLGDWLLDRDDPRGNVVVRFSAKATENLGAFWRLFGLNPEHAAYLTAFSQTRRMRRDKAKARLLPDPVRQAVGLPVGAEGGYFVGGGGYGGQEHDDSVLDYNSPPKGQPGLWCQWVVNEDGTAIIWDGVEKFYDYIEWLEYLLAHFLGPWGYVVNGQMTWQGENDLDRGTIRVVDNVVKAVPEGRRT